MPDLSPKQKRALVATVVVVLAAVATAWALQSVGEAGSDYRVTVARDGSVAAAFDLDALRKLPARKVVMQGQEQQGPSLLSLLDKAGINSFDQVRVLGMGVRDDGVIVLKASQIDEDVLLDVAERGTTKLCGPRIAWADRVRDVQRIEVR